MNGYKIDCPSCDGCGFKIDTFSIRESIMQPFSPVISILNRNISKNGYKFDKREICQECHGFGFIMFFTPIP